MELLCPLQMDVQCSSTDCRWFWHLSELTRSSCQSSSLRTRSVCALLPTTQSDSSGYRVSRSQALGLLPHSLSQNVPAIPVLLTFQIHCTTSCLCLQTAFLGSGRTATPTGLGRPGDVTRLGLSVRARSLALVSFIMSGCAASPHMLH